MSVIIKDDATMKDINALPIKSNLLKAMPIPELLDANGNPFNAKTGVIAEIVGDHMMCDSRHVQLHAPLPFTVTYKILSDAPIDKLLVSTYNTGSTNFGYGRYEVYLSEQKETLYNAENYIAEYDRRDVWNPKELYKGTAQIFSLAPPRKANYFGIKFTHGSIIDTVVRLDLAGVFSKEAAHTQERLRDFGADLTECAATVFDKDFVTYTFTDLLTIDSMAVNAKDAVVEISEDGETFSPIVLTLKSKDSYYLHTAPFKAKAIRSAFGTVLGAFSTVTQIVIDKNTVVTDDFVGAGTNLIPTQLMSESTEKFGYSPDFIKTEFEAIRSLDPKVVRVWFQNDWFQLGPDEYDFESEKMQQFYGYMEIFRELGTEIELDFSFAVGRKLHSWFTIPEIPDQGRSAPRDTKQFARSVAACLEYLCDTKGFNVKYLTVSNEPENKNFSVTPDNNMADKKKYYAQTLRDIDAVLKAKGIRERFEIWGPEDSSCAVDRDWLGDMYNYADDVIDCYTKHCYFSTNDEILNNNFPFYFKSTNNGRVGLTEFGCHLPVYRKSTVGNFISAANAGASVALHWCLTNSVLTDPFSSPFDEDICLYRNDDFKNEELYIEAICGEYGPAMKYVPAHSRVLKTSTSNIGDARAATFEKDGDITIVVETNMSGCRDLKIDISHLTDKPIYKIAYNIGEQKRPTTIMATPKKIETVDGCIIEKLETNHMVYYYTTISRGGVSELA